MRGIHIDGPYSALLYTNIEAQQLARSTIPETALARSSLELTTTGFAGSATVDVPEGTPVLMAGQGNWQGGMVSGSWLKLYRPDGSLIDTITATNAEQMVIPAAPGSPGGAILCALIINPEPGMWMVDYFVDAGAPDVELTAGAMPAENAAYVMSEEVSKILQHAAESDARTSWACMGCQVAAYGLALAIVVAVGAASTAILTVDSAVIVATAGFLGVSASIALALVAGLVVGGTATVDFVLTNLCEWANVC